MASHRSAIDDTREGMKLERYESSCEKLYLRYLDELASTGREDAKERGLQRGLLSAVAFVV